MPRPDTSRGSVTSEFALAMALFLVPFLAGTFDVAKYLDIGNIMNHAAREGVVAAYAFEGYSIFPWQEYMPGGITASATARRE